MLFHISSSTGVAQDWLGLACYKVALESVRTVESHLKKGIEVVQEHYLMCLPTADPGRTNFTFLITFDDL